jgi:hypothetical protein
MMLRDQVGLEHLVRWVDEDPRYRRFVLRYRGPVVEIGTRWRGGWSVYLESSRVRHVLPSHVGHSILAAALKATKAYGRKKT